MEGIRKYYSECVPDRYPHKIGGFIKPVIDYLNMDYESFKHDICTMTDTDLLTKLDQIKYNDILNPYAIIAMKALRRGYICYNFLNEDIIKKIRMSMNNLRMIDTIIEFEYEKTEFGSENEEIEFNYENFKNFMMHTYGKSMSEKIFIELCKIKNAMNIDVLIY